MEKLKKEFYIKNREEYLEKIDNNTISIFFSGRTYQKTNDQVFNFEVNKNFYYLTGINQANVILVLVKNVNKLKNRELLFIEENDPVLVKWVGRTLYKEEVTEISGIENVNYLDLFDKTVYSYLNLSRGNGDVYKTLYLDLERRNNSDYSSKSLEYARKIKKTYPELSISNSYNLVIGLRMFKKPAEIAYIEDAIKVTKGGIEEMMKNSCPGLYEYQLESYFNQYIMFNGQHDNSFGTICGGGVNATTLHYEDNNCLLNDNELVLCDLGCRTNFYISDITRTFPVNGKFTSRQKEVYEEVLNVNKHCIEFLKVGVTYKEYNDYARSLLTKACIKLGLIDKEEDLVKYYWHSIGHSIGLDTHDPDLYNEPFKEGFVVTVEPGLYIEEEKIGVRIEDNVMITRDGRINLSKDIIKEVKDIEEFMKK